MEYVRGLHNLESIVNNGHDNLKNKEIFEKQEADDYLKSLYEEDKKKSSHTGSDGRIIKEPTWNDNQLLAIGEHIRNLRNSKRFSQHKLEKVCDINTHYCGFIERGKFKSLDIHFLMKIQDGLQANFNHLLIEVNKISGTFAKRGGHHIKRKKEFSRKEEPIIPARKLFERTKIYMEEFKGDDWVFQCEVGTDYFEIKINSGVNTIPVRFKGNRGNYSFLYAMEEAVKMIRESFKL